MLRSGYCTKLGNMKVRRLYVSQLSRTNRSLYNFISEYSPLCAFFSQTNNLFRNHKTTGMATRSGSDSGSVTNLKQQQFDYFLVLDFEATCEDGCRISPQEIIEFPVLKINARTLETDAIFHQYVLPRVNPQLTPFCIQLTGIVQDMVDRQPHIEDVVKSFNKWMLDNDLLDPAVRSLFVTCGDWDLKTMLPSQTRHFNIHTPPYFNRWLNIKKAFAEVTSKYPRSMMEMLQQLNVTHQGRHHSGIDDCKNIGNILRELLRRGYVAKISSTLRR